jgi:hypothetical protein
VFRCGAPPICRGHRPWVFHSWGFLFVKIRFWKTLERRGSGFLKFSQGRLVGDFARVWRFYHGKGSSKGRPCSEASAVLTGALGNISRRGRLFAGSTTGNDPGVAPLSPASHFRARL